MERLKKRREFLRVAAARRKWVAPGLILQLCPRNKDSGASRSNGGEVRYGLTVSRKVGNAVARNRARRRLRAAARQVLPAHAARGYDYVLIGRGATLSRPYARLVADLETALRKVSAYRDDGDGEEQQP